MVRNFKLKDRSVILIKEGSPLANENTLDDLRNTLSQTALKDIIIIVVDDFEAIKILDEYDMARHGWIKTANIGKIIKREKDDNV